MPLVPSNFSLRRLRSTSSSYSNSPQVVIRQAAESTTTVDSVDDFFRATPSTKIRRFSLPSVLSSFENILDTLSLRNKSPKVSTEINISAPILPPRTRTNSMGSGFSSSSSSSGASFSSVGTSQSSLHVNLASPSAPSVRQPRSILKPSQRKPQSKRVQTNRNILATAHARLPSLDPLEEASASKENSRQNTAKTVRSGLSMHLPLEGIKWLEIEEGKTKSRPNSLHKKPSFEAPATPIDVEASSIRSESTSIKDEHSTEPIPFNTKQLQAPSLVKATEDGVKLADHTPPSVSTTLKKDTKPSTASLKPATDAEWAEMQTEPFSVSKISSLRKTRQTSTRPLPTPKDAYEMLNRRCDYAIKFWNLQIRDLEAQKQRLNSNYTPQLDEKIQHRNREIEKLNQERQILAEELQKIK